MVSDEICPSNPNGARSRTVVVPVRCSVDKSVIADCKEKYEVRVKEIVSGQRNA